MGLVNFVGFGDISISGLLDGADGKIQDFIEAIPRDKLYWISGDNLTSMVPHAEFKEGRVVIDVTDDIDFRGGRPAIGVRMFQGATVQKADENSTIFNYHGSTYEVLHLTTPFYQHDRKTA